MLSAPEESVGLELGAGQLGRLAMVVKDGDGWLLEEAALLLAQKLPCMGATGTLLMAEKATLVLAVYRAVRGLIIAGDTVICILLEQEVCPAMAESVGRDDDTSSLMGGRATWKTVLDVTVAAVLVSTMSPGCWAGLITLSRVEAWTTLVRGPKFMVEVGELLSAPPDSTCKGWCGEDADMTSTTAFPKPFSIFMLPLEPGDTLFLSSKDKRECTEEESSFMSAEPRSGLCTELSMRMGVMCEGVGDSICMGSAWWPPGPEPASFCTGSTWAVGLAELEGKWFSSITGFSLSEASRCSSRPGERGAVRTALGMAGGTAGGLCLRLSFSSALSELSSRVWIPMGLELELEYSEELPSRGRGWAG